MNGGSPYNSVEPVHPAVREARDLIQLEQDYRDRPDDAMNRLGRAVLLSPTLAICEALIRGEVVPINRLDPAWVRRYGLRDSA